MDVDADPFAVVIARPGLVVAVFLVLTAVFGAGLLVLDIHSGLEPFVRGTPEYETLGTVEDEFLDDGEDPTTQVVQTGEHVVSRRGLLRMLAVEERLHERRSLRVADTKSAAAMVARRLDPGADSPTERRVAVERATAAEVRDAVAALAGEPSFRRLVGEPFSPRTGEASAALMLATHDSPVQNPRIIADDVPIEDVQYETRHVVAAASGDFAVYGRGIISDEFNGSIFDSLGVLIPVVAVVITLFLAVAYRDPVDVVVGSLSVNLVILWTVGFVGLAAIPFSLMLVAVIPLLSGIGIDFSVHVIDRYREEGGVTREAMARAIRRLRVAFAIVAGTTLLGFFANLTSGIGAIRDFGVVAGVGMIFAFMIFAFFMPAFKLLLDGWRDRHGFARWSTAPIGAEGSLVGDALERTVRPARRAPVPFLVAFAVVAVVLAGYATGVGTEFQRDNFLPLDDKAEALDAVPVFDTDEYTIREIENVLDGRFTTTGSDRATVYVEAPFREPSVLTGVERAVGSPPPDAFVATAGGADQRSPTELLRAATERDPTADGERPFARGDVPTRNLGSRFDRLPDRERSRYLSDDHGRARYVFSTESDASIDEAATDVVDVASDAPYEARPTGHVVIYSSVADRIRRSTLTSLAASIALIAVFLALVYRRLGHSLVVGLVNLAPILVAVALVVATMRVIGIELNAVTSTILAITMGIGIDFSVHLTHRIVDELDEIDDGDGVFDAIERAVRGTGGALTGSMVTDVLGIGSAVLALTPILVSFGILMSLSVFYSYLATMLVLPSAFVLLDRGGYLPAT